MALPLRDRCWFVSLAVVCRILLAALFVVSGFLKAIDPWGTIFVLENYLVAYNVALPEWLVLAASLLLCGLELGIGLLLLLKAQIRIVSVITLATMALFTIVTFLSATFVPVEDCGCFGEAITLTPWQTFAKNLVLLPMAVCVWYHYRTEPLFDRTKWVNAAMAAVLILSFGLGIYSYRHLPLIDFLPYKVGVNISEEMDTALSAPSAEKVTLIYRNRTTGELHEFAIEDSEWQNEELWEWVDTRTENITTEYKATVLEFQVSDIAGNDRTAEILAMPKAYLLFCEHTTLDEDVIKHFCAVEEYASQNGGEVLYITSSQPLPTWYTMDAKTMKTILRAKYGMVVLERGTIVAKYNYRDINL